MSIIDELLVFLDDNDPVSLDEIKKSFPKRTLQIVSATLGRLEAKKLVKSNKKNAKKLYQITPEGSEFVTLNLQEIKKYKQIDWNESWHLVVFHIPEKERSKRDLFRIFLEKQGYGRLQDSLWLSPWNRSEPLKYYINKLGISKYVTYFETGKLNVKNQQIVISEFIWQWEKLNETYREFMLKANAFLKSKKDLFIARLLVYEYAKILQIDPKFPDEISPKDYLGKKAYDIYQKIRPHCYKSQS